MYLILFVKLCKMSLIAKMIIAQNLPYFTKTPLKFSPISLIAEKKYGNYVDKHRQTDRQSNSYEFLQSTGNRMKVFYTHLVPLGQTASYG